MPSHGDDYFRYIPVRQRDVQWGLYVTGAGCTFIPPGEPQYPPDTHPELYHFRWETGRTLPEYQVIYITKGEGRFESAPTGGKEIVPGTVILLFPGVWHRYRPRPETGWDEYWVSFNGEIMDRLVQQRFFAPERAVIATGLQDAILAPYQSLLERLRGQLTGFPHLIAADTLEILAAVSAAAECEPAELIAHGPQDVVAVKDRMVAEAMRLIWQQSQGPMTVDSLSRQLPMTRRSLERRFRPPWPRHSRGDRPLPAGTCQAAAVGHRPVVEGSGLRGRFSQRRQLGPNVPPRRRRYPVGVSPALTSRHPVPIARTPSAGTRPSQNGGRLSQDAVAVGHGVHHDGIVPPTTGGERAAFPPLHLDSRRCLAMKYYSQL